MFDVFAHTEEEKEQEIVDMLERGYSWKTIMSECHVSPNTISAVKNKYFGPSGNQKLMEASRTSKESQAFQLFQQGRSVIDVKIQLDIDSVEVVNYYRRYQELGFLNEFNIAYDTVKGNIAPFLRLFDLMNYLAMTPDQVAEQVRYGNNLPYIKSSHSMLSNEIQALQSQKQSLDMQLNFVQSHFDGYMKSLEYFNNEIESKRNELLCLNSEINNSRVFIQNLDHNEGFIRIKEYTKKETKVMIQNNYVLSAVTLTATLEAIRRYPDNQMLMFDIISSSGYSTNPNEQPWESHKSQLLQLMGNVQNDIAEQIANAVITNVKSLPYNS